MPPGHNHYSNRNIKRHVLAEAHDGDLLRRRTVLGPARRRYNAALPENAPWGMRREAPSSRSTFEVVGRFRCTMRLDCSQLDAGAVIRPVPGGWHPRAAASRHCAREEVRFAGDFPLEGTGFEPSVPRNRRPSRRQYRHIWAHGAWRRANSGVTHDLSRHSQPPGTVKRWIGGQFFEPVRSPDTLGATSRMKHSIDWRSWSRLRLPWKLI
jgi:hypothetical protein